MLVLARKTGETVIVTLPDGREMRVVVVDIDRNKIRLGFTAPDDVKIMREELVRR
jgi:carbon storage regulator CsrA